MTYLELYMAQHATLTDEDLAEKMLSSCPRELNGTLKACPPDLRDGDKRNIQRCVDCWNREIPGTEPINKTENNNEREETTMPTEATTTTKKTKAQLLEEIEGLKTRLDNLKKYEQYENMANEMYAVMDSFMKAGFTRGEAFNLTCELIKSAANMVKR